MSYSSQEIRSKKGGLLLCVCGSGESVEQVPKNVIKWTLKLGVEE